MNVLDLSHIELATQEDKEWNLDFWARLFKAKTWEKMTMIAKDNEYFTEASNTLCDLYADFNVRERCIDREDYELEQKYLHDTIAQQSDKILQQENMLAQQAEELEQSRKDREELERKIEELTKALAAK